MSKILEQDMMDYIIPVFRDDDYGHSVTGLILENFEERGRRGRKPIPYPVDADGYEDTVRAIASAVDGAEGRNVGVLVGAYYEVSDILEAAAGYESLMDIRWYATESVIAQRDRFSEAGLQAAARVELTGALASNLDGIGHSDLSDRLEEALGEAPDIFAFSTYDSMWILGRAMLATQSVAQADLVPAIPMRVCTTTGSADWECWMKTGTWPAPCMRCGAQLTENGCTSGRIGVPETHCISTSDGRRSGRDVGYLRACIAALRMDRVCMDRVGLVPPDAARSSRLSDPSRSVHDRAVTRSQNYDATLYKLQSVQSGHEGDRNKLGRCWSCPSVIEASRIRGVR